MKDEIRIFYLLGRSVLSRTLARKLTCEESVQCFLNLGRTWTSGRPCPAQHYLNQFLRFHRSVKVIEADPEGPDDIVELTFGKNHPVIADRPLDTRNLSDDDCTFADRDELCFAFERRVFPSLMDDADADDDNVAMRVYLSFGGIAELREQGGLGDGIQEGYAELEDYYLNIDDYREFTRDPSAARLLRLPPSKITVVVQPAG